MKAIEDELEDMEMRSTLPYYSLPITTRNRE
jgi:hypothetical protein